MNMPPSTDSRRALARCRENLYQAALSILASEPDAAEEHLQEAARWARACRDSGIPSQEDEYSDLVSQGRFLRQFLLRRETEPHPDAGGWQPTTDRLGAIMRNGETTYVVHCQPSRRAAAQWRWGSGDGLDTRWDPLAYDCMADAQEAAEAAMASTSVPAPRPVDERMAGRVDAVRSP